MGRVLIVALVAGWLATVSFSPISHASPANTTNQRSAKLLRERLQAIPLNLNTCIAVLDGGERNMIEHMYCDGELIFERHQIVHVTRMYERIHHLQASSLFFSAMLEIGFTVKTISATNVHTAVFQRILPVDRMDSNSF